MIFPKSFGRWIIGIATITRIYCGVYTVNELPNIDLQNTVQFYYLESSFPPNTPQSIV
jgi:hypothetical protein